MNGPIQSPTWRLFVHVVSVSGVSREWSFSEWRVIQEQSGESVEDQPVTQECVCATRGCRIALAALVPSNDGHRPALPKHAIIGMCNGLAREVFELLTFAT